MFNKLTVILLLSFCFFSQAVMANLLISPTRISFDERQRTAKVTVINTSDEYKTYRVQWSEKQSTSTGGYVTLLEPTATSLSPMTRLSPKQMRLAPGEKQTVKIAIRKPKQLADGEYRSHLLFQTLPNENPNSTSSIKINMIMSYSIPVVLRQNAKIPTVEIEQVQVVQNPINQRPELKLKLIRDSDFSSYGKLSAYYQSNTNDKLEKIAEIGNLSIYPEVNNADVTLSLFSDKTLDKPGNIIFKYIGSEEYTDVNFAELNLAVSAKMLKF
ncbi:fimbria/pilus periplasmic chaperone [Pseudoalteromonas sp. KG3]|uniref:Molecular chaperone n=1 Tax=Pseudoalteromonas prydzensis TaxID=182141 RepID=A0ABR9FLD8_9GAMM|nr:MULTISPECIES: fimbria/pilus periplasmic chaperone [Pseudoalteromonas]MBE0457640.1 molecular chaperone [Pseudoalteromonas prydzensis]WKD24748.1 fimbria/pilus periplasmic chaperone [Pseudoalteromonas sp. KG3]